VDDHRDFAPAVSSRIHAVDDLMTPDRNLEVQTAVIAGARAFVGTYGGYAYLAPFCNVPAIAFYSNRDGFHAYHLELADRVFRRMNTASLVALDVRDAALLRAALGAAQDQHA
jgi:ADP-heptose:LPS heptosyltransferase